MDVRDLSERIGVVTGAGSGIGAATALALAERGADLALCDVDEGGLAETAKRIEGLGRTVLRVRVDVAQQDQVAAFADRVFDDLGRVDVLVNNAGIGVGGNFVDIPIEAWDRIVGINLLGVGYGCHAFLPRMIAAGRPAHVVNIASMAGYAAAPGLSAYCATKFGVVGLSESLRIELAPHRIGVTAICPGVINTAIVQTSAMYGDDATEENRARGVRLYERRNYGPERVAANILKAIQKDRAVAPVSLEAWAFYYLKRLAPGLVRWIGSLGGRAQRGSAAPGGR